MNIREAAKAIEPLIDSWDIEALAYQIDMLPDGPLRTVLINAWKGLDRAEERRHSAAQQFGKNWSFIG